MWKICFSLLVAAASEYCSAGQLSLEGGVVSHGPLDIDEQRSVPCPAGSYSSSTIVMCIFPGEVHKAPSADECLKNCPAGTYRLGNSVELQSVELGETELYMQHDMACPAGLFGNITFRCNNGKYQEVNSNCGQNCSSGSSRVSWEAIPHGGQRAVDCDSGQIVISCTDGRVSVDDTRCSGSATGIANMACSDYFVNTEETHSSGESFRSCDREQRYPQVVDETEKCLSYNCALDDRGHCCYVTAGEKAVLPIMIVGAIAGLCCCVLVCICFKVYVINSNGTNAEQCKNQESTLHDAIPAATVGNPDVIVAEVVPTEVGGNTGRLASELGRLHELHKSGALTDDEFSAAKARVLANEAAV